MGSTGSNCYTAGMYSGTCGGVRDAKGSSGRRHSNRKHFAKGETFTGCGQCSAPVTWMLSQADPPPKK